MSLSTTLNDYLEFTSQKNLDTKDALSTLLSYIEYQEKFKKTFPIYAQKNNEYGIALNCSNESKILFNLANQENNS